MDSISEKLNIAVYDHNQPIETTYNEVRLEKIEDDFDKSRKTIHTILEVGKKAVENLGVMAETSQMADYYDVLAKILKTTSDASKDLLTLHEQRDKVSKIAPLPDSSEVKVHFRGSTAELAKMITSKEIKHENV